MPHVVTDNCIKCKYTDCVDVCPVVCFHESDEFLVINPDECIDCGICIDYCAADAIKPEEELEDHEKFFVEFNRDMAQLLPVVTCSTEPLSEADKWNGVPNKIELLECD